MALSTTSLSLNDVAFFPTIPTLRFPPLQGHIDGDVPVAVSVLRNGAAVRAKDFSAHVAMLSSMASPHLVALLGYCCEDEHKILVHELCINGSLHDRLHGAHIWHLLRSLIPSNRETGRVSSGVRVVRLRSA